MNDDASLFLKATFKETVHPKMKIQSSFVLF